VLLKGEFDVSSLLDYFEDLTPSIMCARVSVQFEAYLDRLCNDLEAMRELFPLNTCVELLPRARHHHLRNWVSKSTRKGSRKLTGKNNNVKARHIGITRDKRTMALTPRTPLQAAVAGIGAS
jgi:hypothetical protein